MMGIGCAEATEPNSLPSAKDFPGGWKRIPFTIQGKPKITHELNVHYPIIGGMGKDSYTLKGTMEFDNKKIKIAFASEPQSLFAHAGNYYLVNRYYFSRTEFSVFKYDEQSQRFIELTSVLYPEEIFNLELANEYSDRSFKLWSLQNLYKNKGFDKSFSQFETYVKTNPTCLLSPSNYQAEKISFQLGSYFPYFDGGIIDLYIKDIEKKNNGTLKERLYDYLETILNSAGPVARGDEINGLFYRMYQVLPEKTNAALREYIMKIKNDKNIRDDRLSYLEDLLRYIEKKDSENKTKTAEGDPNQ